MTGFHVYRYQAPIVKQAEGENQQERENKQSIISSIDIGEGSMICTRDLLKLLE